MKALKINTGERKVEEIEINSWRDIAPAIGNGCETFDVPVVLEDEYAIYCDDEGLFHDFQGGFVMEGWVFPIVGNAIVMETDETRIDPKITKEELEKMIKWVDKKSCEAWANHVRTEH